MNTFANTHQNHDNARTTVIEMLRRAKTSALLAAATTGLAFGLAVGLAATGQADTGAQTPNGHTATTAPMPVRNIDGFGNGAPGYHPTPHHCHGHCH